MVVNSRCILRRSIWPSSIRGRFNRCNLHYEQIGLATGGRAKPTDKNQQVSPGYQAPIYSDLLGGRHPRQGTVILGELQGTHAPAHRQRSTCLQAVGHCDELATRAVLGYAARAQARMREDYYGFRLESVADAVGRLA